MQIRHVTDFISVCQSEKDSAHSFGSRYPARENTHLLGLLWVKASALFSFLNIRFAFTQKYFPQLSYLHIEMLSCNTTEAFITVRCSTLNRYNTSTQRHR